MKKILPISSLAVLLTLMVGCYPGGPEYYSDLDIVITDYKAEYWSSSEPATYYMPDSLNWIFDKIDEDNNIDLPRGSDAFILGLVASNMASAGYLRVDTFNINNPTDVVVFVQALAIDNTYVGWYPGYPYWGYGGYWGGYYPYYGYPVTYSYSTGTVLIEMVDGPTIDIEKGLLPIVWLAGIDGLLRESTASNQEYIAKGINQAFKQSPYLKN
ncbi:MAG: DUF4136 domain-containing protein [Bacteroidota bacterium]|nr:MAG: DUF4136 domain-containing protein [Bacteroidota bacterium]